MRALIDMLTQEDPSKVMLDLETFHFIESSYPYCTQWSFGNSEGNRVNYIHAEFGRASIFQQWKPPNFFFPRLPEWMFSTN